MLLYKAKDAMLNVWSFVSVLYEETELNATMIECPNFFAVTSTNNEQYVLIMSLMIGSSHQTLARVGSYNRNNYTFIPSTTY